MLFSEPFFLLLFLPAAVGAFYVCARQGGSTLALAALFVLSCIFYANWGWFFFALMMLGTVVNYAICIALIRLAAAREPLRKALLWMGQLYNFGTLVYFKYLAFYLLADDVSRDSLRSAAIPIGISFYTFQQAVLLIDAYARKEEVVRYLGDVVGAAGKLRSFIRYGAFHCFFPQLVIGPITYMSEFAPQILGRGFGHPVRRNFEVGITLIVIGLCKKLVLADNLAAIADPSFDAVRNGALLTPGQAWAGALAFFVQLYFDFSGYSDMALGIARLFGVRLPINFNSPLRAAGIVDFYRRWHITLTRVIGRFLFTPLSLWGTRRAFEWNVRPWQRKLMSAWIPLLINFEVIALWHGALGTYVIFGLVHGTWFIIETEIKSTKRWRAYKERTSEATRRLRGQLFTFLPLMLTFALFRSDTLATFNRLLWCMIVGGAERVPALKVNANAWLLIAAAFAIVWLLPNSIELLRRYRPGIPTWLEPSTTPMLTRYAWRPSAAWALVVAALGVTSLIYINRELPFIYMGF